MLVFRCDVANSTWYKGFTKVRVVLSIGLIGFSKETPIRSGGGSCLHYNRKIANFAHQMPSTTNSRTSRDIINIHEYFDVRVGILKYHLF